METKKLDYKLHKFDSGLRLVTIPMDGTRTVTVFVLVGTGSKYETKEINGISHFLEHMMFKGTVKRPGNLDISREFDTLGAEYNAYTHKEWTGYYARASADKLDIVMDLISDIFLNSKLDERDITMEKGVIIEEINMYNDDPPRYVGVLLERLLYGDQPAGWDIAGDKDTVSKLERKDFVNYFESHYIAGNTVVAIAGNINHEEVKEKAARYFEKTRVGTPVSKLAVIEAQTEPKSLVFWKETDQAHFNLGLRAFNMFDDRRYALGLMSMILGGGMSSRLFQEVRVKRGLAYYVGSDTEFYTDTGVFGVHGGVDKSRTFEALEVVMAELAKIKAEGVTEKELQQAKDHTRGSLALFSENSRNIAMYYGDSVLFDKKVLTLEDKLDKINRVTVDDVNNAVKEVFQGNKLNFAIIGPFKEEEPFKKILNI